VNRCSDLWHTSGSSMGSSSMGSSSVGSSSVGSSSVDSSMGSGSSSMRMTGWLPRNNLRLVIRPNTRASVAGYKAVEAAYFQGPQGKVHHVDDNQGCRCRNERIERTMHVKRLTVKLGRNAERRNLACTWGKYDRSALYVPKIDRARLVKTYRLI
jgi:hypothetical protein